MIYIFHILINSADTDEMPLFGSSLFAKVPVYYYCLPVPRQLKFTKVIQACVCCIAVFKTIERQEVLTTEVFNDCKQISGAARSFQDMQGWCIHRVYYQHFIRV